MLITGGEVTLYIVGSINMSGQSYIYIAPGASLRLGTAADPLLR